MLAWAGAGRFLLTLIAKRAQEVGASGIVLACPAIRVQWYKDAGALEGAPEGWKCATGLVALRFEHEACEDLRGTADALKDKEGSETWLLAEKPVAGVLAWDRAPGAQLYEVQVTVSGSHDDRRSGPQLSVRRLGAYRPDLEWHSQEA